jgi:hypothetical protein
MSSVSRLLSIRPPYVRARGIPFHERTFAHYSSRWSTVAGVIIDLPTSLFASPDAVDATIASPHCRERLSPHPPSISLTVSGGPVSRMSLVSSLGTKADRRAPLRRCRTVSFATATSPPKGGRHRHPRRLLSPCSAPLRAHRLSTVGFSVGPRSRHRRRRHFGSVEVCSACLGLAAVLSPPARLRGSIGLERLGGNDDAAFAEKLRDRG